MLQAGQIVVPGQVLVQGLADGSGADPGFSCGRGTMVRGADSAIVATVWGQARVANSPPVAEDAGGDARVVVEVVVLDDGKTAVPKVGDTVTCVVTRLTNRHASVSILCIGDAALAAPFHGIIRSQDVRATEIETVLVHDAFHPTDVVVARVLSLGDRKSFFLTTAENELGVVFATSAAGATMVPVSWDKMMCPKTKVLEKRKVAQPQN